MNQLPSVSDVNTSAIQPSLTFAQMVQTIAHARGDRPWFGGSVFRKFEKEKIAELFLRNLYERQSSLESGVDKEAFIEALDPSRVVRGVSLNINNFGANEKALADMINDGYFTESDGEIFASKKLKEAYMQTATSLGAGDRIINPDMLNLPVNPHQANTTISIGGAGGVDYIKPNRDISKY